MTGWDKERYDDLVSQLESENKTLRKALEGMMAVSHRLSGCPDPDCGGCRENRAAIKAANDALKEKVNA